MSFGITEEQLSIIVRLLSGFPEIEQAVIFGSRADGTYSDISDVDIAVKGNFASSLIIAKINGAFEESNLPWFFDIIDYNSLSNEILKEHIDNKGILFYERGY